jgi:hypothetical protein
MHALCSYDYAIIRAVPRVEREEFINVGVILSCPDVDFVAARIDLDESRLRALDPVADIGTIRRHADVVVAICRGGPESGPIGGLPKRERYHWPVAPRSTVIQMSPSHAGQCTEPEKALEHLLESMVRVTPG